MSLVVWLPFNNSTNNQGTSTCNLGSGSPSYSTGKVTRYCLNSGGWVNYNSSNLVIPMTTTGTFSMGAWIKNKDTSVSTNAWVFVIGEGDNVCKGLWNGTGYTTNLHWAYSSSGQNISTSINTQDGNWHHIFFVNDKPNGTCTLWVDGQKQGSITLNSNGLNACTKELVKVNSTYYAINDFRIYNHCLSTKEIKELARGLALHYKFNFEDLYVPVEYIQSSGTQYIDTGVVPSTTLRGQVVLKPNTSYISEYSILGSTWSASGYFLMFYQSKIRFHSRNYVYDTTNNATSSKTTIDFYSHNLTTNCLIVDGVAAPNTANYGDTADSANTIHIFDTLNSDKRGRFTLYSCKFYDNDKLIRNFIPCIRKCDSKPGLFDLVNNVFYTNSGSGEFTYPSTTITNTIIDNSGYGLNGTPSNITTTTTNIGTSAILFNGSSSKVDYNYLPLTSNMTYVLWMKFNSTASAHIIDNRATSGETGYQPMYGGTTYGLQCYSSNGGSYTWSSATCGFTTGVWYHLAVVITPSNATLYINGVSKGTQSGTFGSEIGARLMRLGARCSNANWFNGQMSELRVYNTALSADDIKTLYNTRESVDNTGNDYCNTILEDTTISNVKFTNKGIIETPSLYETITLDDGSTWMPICIHNVANGVFANSGDFTTLNSQTLDRWSNFGLINVASRPESGWYEFLVQHQTSVGGIFQTYRWKQNKNPFSATWADVEPSTVGTNVIRVSSSTTSSYGGMYWMNASNCKMCFANTSNGNWFGCGICSYWGTGYIPSYNGQQCYGWQLVYIRVSNTTSKILKNGFVETKEIKEA